MNIPGSKNFNGVLYATITVICIFFSIILLIFTYRSIIKFVQSCTPNLIKDIINAYVFLPFKMILNWFHDFFTMLYYNYSEPNTASTANIANTTNTANTANTANTSFITSVYVFFVYTLPTFIIAIPLHIVIPYIVLLLLIIMLVYPLFGMRIDCQGKTKSGGCVEQFQPQQQSSDIANNDRHTKPITYEDPKWVNVQLQKIKQEIRFNILKNNPQLLGNEDALTREVEKTLIESRILNDNVLKNAQDIQDKNVADSKTQKDLIALGKERTIANMKKKNIQSTASMYKKGEYSYDNNTRGMSDRYNIQYHESEDSIKKDYAPLMLKESNIPYIKNGRINKLHRLYVQNQPHYSKSSKTPVLLIEKTSPQNIKNQQTKFIPSYEESIILSSLRPEFKK